MVFTNIQSIKQMELKRSKKGSERLICRHKKKTKTNILPLKPSLGVNGNKLQRGQCQGWQ